MKKVIVTIIASGLVASVVYAGTSVTVDFASAYVFRGATAVDDLVVQPGIEVDGFGLDEEYGSIALGVWGSAAPFEDTYNNLRETDWYAVYTLPELVTNVTLSVGFTEYQYAGGSGEQEINVGASLALSDAIAIGGSANFMVDDEVAETEDQIYIDLYADYSIEVSEDMDASVGALIGFMKQGDENDSVNGWDDGLNQYELYGAFSYAINEMWSIGGSLAYIGQLDDDVLTDAAHDKGLVAMFSVGCDM
jgi:uncharacterized protein (TIGR02001 family)